MAKGSKGAAPGTAVGKGAVRTTMTNPMGKGRSGKRAMPKRGGRGR